METPVPLTELQKEAAKVAATLLLHELLPRLKKRCIDTCIDMDSSPVSPQQLGDLALMKAHGLISTHQVRQFLDKCFDSSSQA